MSKEITPEGSVCPVYLEPLDPTQVEADQAEIEAKAQANSDRQALKTATIAKLGLTVEEVAALLS